MPNMCDTTLTIKGAPGRVAEFLMEVGLDREALAAAEAKMARLVESRSPGRLVLHIRPFRDSLTAYCGERIDDPKRRWASPGWRDRDPQPEPSSCQVCEREAKTDSPWSDTFDRRGMLSFVDVLPPPADCSGEALHRWVIEHWGTKWDLAFTGSFIEEEQAGLTTIILETAWGPPLPVIDEMARRAPDLAFEAVWEAEPMGAIDEIGNASWRDGTRVLYRARPHA
jgi:hypothetical protein